MRPYELLQREQLQTAGLEIEIDRVRRPDGFELGLRRIKAADSVYVVALNEEDQAILVRQWRQSIGRFTVEVVAGAVEDGETPLEAAQRELTEESGYQAAELLQLAAVQFSPGSFDCKQFYYLAYGCRPISGWQQEDEPTETVLLPFAQALEMAGAEIDSSDSVLALLLAARHLRI